MCRYICANICIYMRTYIFAYIHIYIYIYIEFSHTSCGRRPICISVRETDRQRAECVCVFCGSRTICIRSMSFLLTLLLLPLNSQQAYDMYSCNVIPPDFTTATDFTTGVRYVFVQRHSSCGRTCRRGLKALSISGLLPLSLNLKGMSRPHTLVYGLALCHDIPLRCHDSSRPHTLVHGLEHLVYDVLSY
jgi:hypothetical protein